MPELLAAFPEANSGSDYKDARESDNINRRDRFGLFWVAGRGKVEGHAECAEGNDKACRQTRPGSRDVVANYPAFSPDSMLSLVVRIGEYPGCAPWHQLIKFTKDLGWRNRTLVMPDLCQETLLLLRELLACFADGSARRHLPRHGVASSRPLVRGT